MILWHINDFNQLQREFLDDLLSMEDYVDTYNYLMTKESEQHAKADLVGEHEYN